MNSSPTCCRQFVGTMKKAFIPATSRRSRCGIRSMSLEIFWSALIRYSGAPVITAEPRSAVITGAPEYLMSALQKISSDMLRIPQRDLREVAGMNAFFIVPTNWRQQVGELFMDHPPLEKRLAALEKIAREMGRPIS